MSIREKGCDEMANKEKIEQLTESYLLPIIEPLAIELVDVEYVKELGHFYLRAYIDKEGGITVLDCEAVSRALEEKLEESDPIKDAYILEVSSPGLDRPLKKDKDFERSIGKDVEFKLYKALNGQKEFVGTLVSYTAEDMTVRIDDKEEVFVRSTVAHIRLSINF